MGRAIAVAAGADVALPRARPTVSPLELPGTIDDTVRGVVRRGRRGVAIPTDLSVPDKVDTMVGRAIGDLAAKARVPRRALRQCCRPIRHHLRRFRSSVLYEVMEFRITATELARKLGDVLGRVRYRHEVFVVERNGEPIARLAPLPSLATARLDEALRAWRAAGPPEAAFAEDLESVNAADRAPRNPWA